MPEYISESAGRITLQDNLIRLRNYYNGRSRKTIGEFRGI